MKTVILKPNMMIKEDHIKEIQNRIAEEIRRDGVCVIPNGFYYEVVDIDVPEDRTKKYFITTTGHDSEFARSYRKFLRHSTYGMWPKENPHLNVESLYPKQLTFTESYKKDDNLLTPNEVRDIHLNMDEQSKKFQELMEKRIKELKEKDMKGKITFEEITFIQERGSHPVYEFKGWSYIDPRLAVRDYIDTDIAEAKKLINSIYGRNAFNTRYVSRGIPRIKDVRFNGPATIVFWSDDTKTVVKCDGEEFDPEKGIAMAIAKKALGNKHDYYNVIAKYTKKYYKDLKRNETKETENE